MASQQLDVGVVSASGLPNVHTFGTISPFCAAKIETKETTLHGKTRSDPYHWLKDENWQQVCGASFQLSARALQCA